LGFLRIFKQFIDFEERREINFVKATHNALGAIKNY